MISVILSDWKRSRAYVASEDMRCAGFQCGRTIMKGEYYTRAKPRIAWFKWAIHPFCHRCRPFVATTLDMHGLARIYAKTRMADQDKERHNFMY